jgi:hypothetical protein
MIKDSKLLQDFEDRRARMEKPDYGRNLRIVEALYREAFSLGVLPGPDPLEGLDVDIRIAKVLNSVSKTSR